MPRFFLLTLLGLFAPLAGCDSSETTRASSSFEATVSGDQTLALSGVASVNYQERGIPTLWLMLLSDDTRYGLSFARGYELELRPGTYAIGTEEALNGGFSAYAGLPAPPDTSATSLLYWGSGGTLTVTSVEDGRAEGTFAFDAGPGPGETGGTIRVEGTFRARMSERDPRYQ